MNDVMIGRLEIAKTFGSPLTLPSPPVLRERVGVRGPLSGKPYLGLLLALMSYVVVRLRQECGKASAG